MLFSSLSARQVSHGQGDCGYPVLIFGRHFAYLSFFFSFVSWGNIFSWEKLDMGGCSYLGQIWCLGIFLTPHELPPWFFFLSFFSFCFRYRPFNLLFFFFPTTIYVMNHRATHALAL